MNDTDVKIETAAPPGITARSLLILGLSRLGIFWPTNLARGWRAHRGVQQVRVLLPEIARDQQALAEFDQCSCGEFAALASAVAKLESELAKIAGQAAQLNLALHDQDEDRALSSAFELHQKTVRAAHHSIGIAISQGERMAQIESSVLRNRDRFAQNRLKYRVLVMAIRTEAARIDPENRATFYSVADDIDAMERQMNRVVEAAFLRLEEIVNEAAVGRVQLQHLQSSIQQRAHESDQLLSAALQALQRDLAPCAQANDHITQLLEEARSQTNEVVTALQYQDIVRQQLEHVSLGLGDIATHLAPPAAKVAVDLAYLHQAACVHRAHLGSSRTAIENASQQIEQGGQTLLQTGSALMTRFGQMEQAAAIVFRGSRVSELFKQETENLVAIAGLCESTQKRIGDLLNRIEESVGTFSTDIRRHELDVQLIALNSQIAAARVTNAGALNRLAEEISNHSADTARLTQAMSVQLGDALNCLRDIRNGDANPQEAIGHDRADISQRVVVVSEKLDRLNERLQHTSSEITGDFEPAYQEVCGLLSSLQFPRHIAPTFEPAEALCDRLLEATVRFDRATDLTAEGQGRLAAQHGRYTMSGEREAHAAALAHTSAPSGNSNPAFGDNVELF